MNNLQKISLVYLYLLMAVALVVLYGYYRFNAATSYLIAHNRARACLNPIMNDTSLVLASIDPRVNVTQAFLDKIENCTLVDLYSLNQPLTH